MKTINVGASRARCKTCGSNILELGHHVFSGRVENTPSARREFCECSICKTPFILKYPIFDSQGHISHRVFAEDINDPDYNWTDSLSEEQKTSVISHLNSCIMCKERVTDEMLNDAWFASLIKGDKK